MTTHTYIYIYIYTRLAYAPYGASSAEQITFEAVQPTDRRFRLCFWCFWVSGFSFVTGSQADQCFLCFSGFLVTGSPTDRCLICFWCFLVTGSPADRCFHCFRVLVTGSLANRCLVGNRRPIILVFLFFLCSTEAVKPKPAQPIGTFDIFGFPVFWFSGRCF